MTATSLTSMMTPRPAIHSKTLLSNPRVPIHLLYTQYHGFNVQTMPLKAPKQNYDIALVWYNQLASTA